MDALILMLSLWGGPTDPSAQQICGPLYVNTDPKDLGGSKWELMIRLPNGSFYIPSWDLNHPKKRR